VSKRKADEAELIQQSHRKEQEASRAAAARRAAATPVKEVKESVALAIAEELGIGTRRVYQLLAEGTTRRDYAAVFAKHRGGKADDYIRKARPTGRRRKYAPAAGPDPKTADGARLHVVAADTGDAWLVEAHEGRLQPRRVTVPDTGDAGDAGCTLTGPASGVYLYLWNRAGAAPAGVTVTGDPGVLSAWQASVRVRWS